MAGRTLRTIRESSSRLEENLSTLVGRFIPNADFLPEKITWEDPPTGYVPIDLHESPFFVPPYQGSELPDVSDYGLSANIAAFEIEAISASECHVCVTFSYTLGFIKFPSTTVCYIAPECRKEQEKPHPEIPLECVDRTSVDWSEMDDEIIPPTCPRPVPDEGESFGDPGETLTLELWKADTGESKTQGRVNQEGYSSEDRSSPPAQLIAVRSVPAPLIISFRAGDNFRDYSYDILNTFNPNQIFIQRVRAFNLGFYLNNIPWTWASSTNYGTYTYIYTYGSVGFNTFRETESTSIGRSTSTMWTIIKRGADTLWPRPPQTEDESPKRYMPRCCENSTIEELLRRLLKRVGDPKKITINEYDKAKERGVVSLADAMERWSYHQSNSTADFYKVLEPRAFENASYPMRLTHAGAKGSKPIRNYLQAWEAILRQIDTAVGMLPFKIKIEDTNAAQEGNQSLELQVHSISDALKLLVEYMIDTENDGDTTNNILVRLAAMQVQQHQILAKIKAETKNIEEYLDYKVKQRIEKIPITFNPLLPTDGQGFGGATNLNQNTETETERLMPKLLQNTELKVKVTEIDEKRLLSERLFSIERFAAQSAAGNTIPYEGEATIKKLLDGALDNKLLEEFLDRQNIRKALSKELDLDKFGKDVEDGYKSAEGRQESDPNLPFGRDKKRRPKVKKTTRRRR